MNYPSFIWNQPVESCSALTLPPLDFSLERFFVRLSSFCSSFKTGFSSNFLFVFQVFRISNRSKFEGPLYFVHNLLSFQVRACPVSNGSKGAHAALWALPPITNIYIHMCVCVCVCMRVRVCVQTHIATQIWS
jgi:hypothetical protein